MASEGGLDRDDEWASAADDFSGIFGEESCPAVDIRFMVEPLTLAENSIKCTADEIDASNSQKTTLFNFGFDTM